MAILKRALPPKPTEIEDKRLRMGERATKTAPEINRDVHEQMEQERKRLCPIIE